MHFLATLFLLSFVVYGPGATSMSGPPPLEITGSWLGTLSIPGGQLRIVFNITRTEGGGLTATLDSPDQGATGIPTTSVTFQGDSLRIEVGTIQGVYEGRAESEDRIVGTWTQAGSTFPLDLERVKDTTATQLPERPQEPKPPFPYESEDLQFESAEAGVRLAGTLTLPAGAGPFPAVILVSGSGPQDRDETIFGHKPFLVIADHLTRQGIAVLRYDDRGVGGSTGDLSLATIENFVQDARGALQYLQNRAEIDQDRIGILGHSEGALVAPRVANLTDDVAFLVLLAPPGVPGDELLLEQSTLLMRTAGAPGEAIEANRSAQKRIFEVVRQVPVAAQADSIRSILATSGIPKEAAEAQIRQITSPWLRHFITYDPRPALESLDIPVLALFGEKDLQVPAAQNAPIIETALNAGDDSQATVHVLPGLNHLFQTATTGDVSEYARIEETIDPGVLDLISSWITSTMANR